MRVPTVRCGSGHVCACPEPRTGYVHCEYCGAFVLERPEESPVMRRIVHPRNRRREDKEQLVLWPDNRVTTQPNTHVVNNYIPETSPEQEVMEPALVNLWNAL